MTTPDRAADRRRIAEAMGWRIEQGESLVAGTVRVWNPAGECVACCADDLNLYVWNFPDPWADDAAAWRLERWLCETSGEYVKPRCVAGRWTCFTESTRQSELHPTMNAALCAAALAWIDSRDAKESENG